MCRCVNALRVRDVRSARQTFHLMKDSHDAIAQNSCAAAYNSGHRIPRYATSTHAMTALPPVPRHGDRVRLVCAPESNPA
ncbi:hypothetical protein BVI2075_860019 [Burkholderia vietnamiensis]|nr:hypothetical protein BVI2075_860019 [Burkholderia vietnamiensis]